MTIEAPKPIKENHPWIVTRINGMWGSKECRDYILKMGVQDSNAGPDDVFPFCVLSWLIDLVKKHDREFPEYANPKQPFTFA